MVSILIRYSSNHMKCMDMSYPGFPRAAEKNPCMEQAGNLKNDEISWKNHGIWLLDARLDVIGSHFFSSLTSLA